MKLTDEVKTKAALWVEKVWPIAGDTDRCEEMKMYDDMIECTCEFLPRDAAEKWMSKLKCHVALREMIVALGIVQGLSLLHIS